MHKEIVNQLVHLIQQFNLLYTRYSANVCDAPLQQPETCESLETPRSFVSCSTRLANLT